MHRSFDSVERGVVHERESRSSSARRRRSQTKGVLGVVVVAILFNLFLRTAQNAGRMHAISKNEACWPLFGTFVRASVVQTAPDTWKTLYAPRYVADPAAPELVRAKESSVLCPSVKTRVRQKTVEMKHGWKSSTTLSGRAAVCVMHVVDFFDRRGNCTSF